MNSIMNSNHDSSDVFEKYLHEAYEKNDPKEILTIINSSASIYGEAAEKIERVWFNAFQSGSSSDPTQRDLKKLQFLDGVAALISENTDPIIASDFLACMNICQYTKAMDIMISKQVSTEHKSIMILNALFEAIERGLYNSINFLIDAAENIKMDLNKKERLTNMSALMKACVFCPLPIMEKIRKISERQVSYSKGNDLSWYISVDSLFKNEYDSNRNKVHFKKSDEFAKTFAYMIEIIKVDLHMEMNGTSLINKIVEHMDNSLSRASDDAKRSVSSFDNISQIFGTMLESGISFVAEDSNGQIPMDILKTKPMVFQAYKKAERFILEKYAFNTEYPVEICSMERSLSHNSESVDSAKRFVQGVTKKALEETRKRENFQIGEFLEGRV